MGESGRKRRQLEQDLRGRDQGTQSDDITGNKKGRIGPRTSWRREEGRERETRMYKQPN